MSEYVECSFEQIMNPREFCFDPDMKQIVEKLDALCERHGLKSREPEWKVRYGASFEYFFQQAETKDENKAIYKELGAIRALADKVSIRFGVMDSVATAPGYFVVHPSYTLAYGDERSKNKGPRVYVEQISGDNVLHSEKPVDENNKDEFLCIPVGDILDLRSCWDKDIRKLLGDLDELCAKHNIRLTAFNWWGENSHAYGNLYAEVILSLEKSDTANHEQIIEEVQKIIAAAEERQLKITLKYNERITVTGSQQPKLERGDIILKIEFEGEKKSFRPRVYVDRRDLAKTDEPKEKSASDVKCAEEFGEIEELLNLQEIRVGKYAEVFKQVLSAKYKDPHAPWLDFMGMDVYEIYSYLCSWVIYRSDAGTILVIAADDPTPENFRIERLREAIDIMSEVDWHIKPDKSIIYNRIDCEGHMSSYLIDEDVAYNALCNLPLEYYLSFIKAYIQKKESEGYYKFREVWVV